jgi:hypothetical protein
VVGTRCEVPEEVLQIWKPILEWILESCAYMDPTAYMYRVTAKHESEFRAEQERMGSRTADVHILRLAEWHRAPREARA